MATATDGHTRAAGTYRLDPTPTDYASLSAGLFLALAGVGALAHARDEQASALGLRDLAITGAAAFTIAKAISRERIGTWVREPLEHAAAEERHSERYRRSSEALRELVTCTRCAGTWTAAGLVGLRIAAPRAGRAVAAALAVAAVNDAAQAGFRLLTERANAAQRAAGRAGLHP